MSISVLNSKTNIIFGPFVGEFGWEVSRWNGFVRWFCLNNKDKNIVISTRESSSGFYFGLGDNVILDLFSIKQDYTADFTPVEYRARGVKSVEIIKKITDDVVSKYPTYYLFRPTQLSRKSYDAIKKYDFNYLVPKEISSCIDHVLNRQKNKKIICIASRHRKDTVNRNWSESNWECLFDLIDCSKNLFGIVVGRDNSIYKSTKPRDNIKYLCSEYNDPTVGLLIEVIKRSSVTIGPQTGVIILSNAMRTPTVFWGHEIKRHSVEENYSNTVSVGIEEKDRIKYVTEPEIIFDEMLKIIGSNNIV